MIRYEEALELAGVSQANKNIPPKEEVFFAYKDGELKEFATIAEARKYSSHTHFVCGVKNEKEIKEAQRLYYKAIEHAEEIWMTALKNKYPQLSEKQFSIIFSRAWEEGHAYGHNAVAAAFEDLVSFLDNFNK